MSGLVLRSAAVFTAAVMISGCGGRLPHGGQSVRAVVVTGGHGFKEGPFFEMADSLAGVEYVRADQGEVFKDIGGWDRDVIVLYNMTKDISAIERSNLLKLLEKGVGLVALHHSIASYPHWPEYERVIGGKFFLESDYPDRPSGYKHGVEMTMHIEDESHPVVEGLDDYVILDECYNKCSYQTDNHLLVSTEHPDSDRPVAWVRKYANARVCYIMSGHGPEAYSNKSFRRLLANAVRWCGRHEIK